MTISLFPVPAPLRWHVSLAVKRPSTMHLLRHFPVLPTPSTSTDALQNPLLLFSELTLVF